jgi:hypothetical protein
MKMTKDGEVQEFTAKLVRRMSAIGWVPVEEKQADDEIIRLKPPVKTKATVTALDEAKKSKGDE